MKTKYQDLSKLDALSHKLEQLEVHLNSHSGVFVMGTREPSLVDVGIYTVLARVMALQIWPEVWEQLKPL